MTNKPLNFPIVDAHIHLIPESEFDSIPWIKPGHPLHRQCSVDEYKSATVPNASVCGYVVIESDRRCDLQAGEEGWAGPLQEVEWYRRLALGEPVGGEGHSAKDSRLALGLVPWAPLPSGPAAMERYLARVEDIAGPAWCKIKGFRYLLQDKAPGTALEQIFIDSLKLLGRRGFIFELCIDYHHRGLEQLDDTVELIRRAHADVPKHEQVTVVFNHMLKPDLTAPFDKSNAQYQAWEAAVTTLGKDPKTYMKVSGALSEMAESTKSLEPSAVADFLLPWFRVIILAFGLERIIFASDWPVCTIGIENSWSHWQKIVENMCERINLSTDDIEAIFAGTARRVYCL